MQLDGGAKAFIRRSDLARDRADQRPERFGKGDKVDALVTSMDKAARKIGLSIKAREVAEEKEAVAQYGSSDSGASLGDILGAALRRRTKRAPDDKDADDDKDHTDDKEEEKEEAKEGSEGQKKKRKGRGVSLRSPSPSHRGGR